MSKTNTIIDALLVENRTSSVIKLVIDTAEKIENLNHRLLELQSRLSNLNAKLCTELSIAIRSKCPQLNINVLKTKCRVSYKTKCLEIIPDPQKRLWIVRSPDKRFEGRFNSLYGSKLLMRKNLSDLARIIADFYKHQFATIKEDKAGIVLIESVRSTIDKLIERNEEFIPGDNQGD